MMHDAWDSILKVMSEPSVRRWTSKRAETALPPVVAADRSREVDKGISNRNGGHGRMQTSRRCLRKIICKFALENLLHEIVKSSL